MDSVQRATNIMNGNNVLPTRDTAIPLGSTSVMLPGTPWVTIVNEDSVAHRTGEAARAPMTMVGTIALRQGTSLVSARVGCELQSRPTSAEMRALPEFKKV
jgi:hypothetical protein